MPKNVIVLGMARSGTSLTAGIFGRKGYYVAPEAAGEKMPTDDANPTGYWEAVGLIERNVELYRAVGFGGHNSWGPERIDEAAIEQLAHLQPLPGHREFITSYDAHRPWVWKDPRLCLTLSYWWPLLSADDTRVLFLDRDPDEIHRSFMRVQFVPREQESRERVFGLIEQHTRSAKKILEQLSIPHLVVQHRRYFEDADALARELGDFLELDLSAQDLHVKRELNHSTASGRARGLVAQVYRNLPGPVRKGIKRLTPDSLRQALAPERRFHDPGSAADPDKSDS